VLHVPHVFSGCAAPLCVCAAAYYAVQQARGCLAPRWHAAVALPCSTVVAAHAACKQRARQTRHVCCAGDRSSRAPCAPELCAGQLGVKQLQTSASGRAWHAAAPCVGACSGWVHAAGARHLLWSACGTPAHSISGGCRDVLHACPVGYWMHSAQTHLVVRACACKQL
jgi:hypothetical protein